MRYSKRMYRTFRRFQGRCLGMAPVPTQDGQQLPEDGEEINLVGFGADDTTPVTSTDMSNFAQKVFDCGLTVANSNIRAANAPSSLNFRDANRLHALLKMSRAHW